MYFVRCNSLIEKRSRPLYSCNYKVFKRMKIDPTSFNTIYCELPTPVSEMT